MVTKNEYDPWIDFSRLQLGGDKEALVSLRAHSISDETIQHMHLVWNQLPQNVQYFGSPDYDYLQIESFLENQVNPSIPLIPATLIALVTLIFELKFDVPILASSIIFIIFMTVLIDRVIRSKAKQALKLLHQINQPNGKPGSA